MVDPLVKDHATTSQSETVQNLILVPTPHELALLIKFLPDSLGESQIELCGFGPIASAARTSQLLGMQRYHHVFLVGIAGSYTSHPLTVGQAYLFERVRCHGVGVGSGATYQSAGDLGWNQLEIGTRILRTQDATYHEYPLETSNAEAAVTGENPRDQPIGDLLNLSIPLNRREGLQAGKPEQRQAGTLLTSCSASADATEAEQRIRLYPDAFAEDMEGFGVTVACHLHETPITIIRGISNHVGNRDHAQWQIPSAMKSVADLLSQVINLGQ